MILMSVAQIRASFSGDIKDLYFSCIGVTGWFIGRWDAVLLRSPQRYPSIVLAQARMLGVHLES